MAAIQSHLLTNLRPSDTMRDGAVVCLNPISRIFFAIKELFCGGWGVRDRAAFKDFHSFTEGRIAILKFDLQNGIHLDDALPELQSLLKVAAKIANCSWGKSLRKGQSEEFTSFQKELTDLRNLAEPHLQSWVDNGDSENRRTISRWITANDSQRRFAAYNDLKEVPYKFDEIQAGAVMITDPEAYLLNRHISGKRSLWKTIVIRIKAFICWFFTGMRYTHAELSLGKGEGFDLDKRKGICVLQGEAVLQQRAGKVFYGTIIVPKKEAMLEAYNRRFPDQQLASFEELWEKIENEARNGVPKIQVGFWDLFKTGIPVKRPENYNCTQAWDPGVNKYSCSATVSSLFSKFGIDIGKQYSKIDQNVTPVDFLNSEFFKPFYVIP